MERRQIFEGYQFQDVAVKAVGIGSVGMRCFVALFLADDNDPLFIEIKEARRSVLESLKGESCFAHQGLRAVHGQLLTQAASDIFLGWFHTHGRYYYLRQFRDLKVSAQIDTLKPRTMTSYATLCGWALVRAHARSGDTATIAGYLESSGRFDDALVSYAVAYADQAEHPFATFKASIRSGRLRRKLGKDSGLEFLL